VKKIQMLVILLLTGMFMVSCGGVDVCDCVQAWKDQDQEKMEECKDHFNSLDKEGKEEWDKEGEKCFEDS